MTNKTSEADDPLQDPMESLTRAQREQVAENSSLKAQATAVLSMPELLERIRQVRQRAAERRDLTFGDEHFVWVGHCIALQNLLNSLHVMAAYEPPKARKSSAASYG